MAAGVHLEGKTLFLAEDEGEVALVVVEVGLETSDGEVFGKFEDGIGHTGWREEYASEGGTDFLKDIWLMLGCYKEGYILIDY